MLNKVYLSLIFIEKAIMNSPVIQQDDEERQGLKEKQTYKKIKDIIFFTYKSQFVKTQCDRDG